MKMKIVIFVAIHVLLCHITPIITLTQAFSGKGFGKDSSSPPPTFTLSDRFRASCPADISSISQYDPSLTRNTDDEEGSIWAAVYRSSNNLPSVLIKDDFMNAMRIATTVQNPNSDGMESSTQIDNGSINSQIIEGDISGDNGSNSKDGKGSGVKAQTPVAIAKLSPSIDFPGKFTLSSMRCSLKKEDTDQSCDGQSEHAEAISICIDELILNHVRNGEKFDGTIRTKATLVSGKLLQSRGFEEVNELCKDMATHVSCIETSIMKYAERAVDIEGAARSPGARDRALQILSFLGKEDAVVVEDEDGKDNAMNSDDNDRYDPWANVGRL